VFTPLQKKHAGDFYYVSYLFLDSYIYADLDKIVNPFKSCHKVQNLLSGFVVFWIDFLGGG
jgi:hypothetical protein